MEEICHDDGIERAVREGQRKGVSLLDLDVGESLRTHPRTQNGLHLRRAVSGHEDFDSVCNPGRDQPRAGRDL
jgi:hypothetical protein